MAIYISNSPEETIDFGARWAATLKAGTLVTLEGELGAGKTQLCKGFGKGLGIHEPVVSPTFALMNEYRSGRLPLYHIDLYRLNGPEDVLSAGLNEYFCRDGICVVEWFCRWGEIKGLQGWRIDLTELSERQREISYVEFGD